MLTEVERFELMEDILETTRFYEVSSHDYNGERLLLKYDRIGDGARICDRIDTYMRENYPSLTHEETLKTGEVQFRVLEDR